MDPEVLVQVRVGANIVNMKIGNSPSLMTRLVYKRNVISLVVSIVTYCIIKYNVNASKVSNYNI